MTRQKMIRLEARLSDFDAAVRRDSLAACAALYSPAPQTEQSHTINMCLRSFFSCNTAAWSPSRIAWEAHKAGWHAAALCDLDQLDGLDEFLAAARVVALRAAVHLETRTRLPGWHENSPNSPAELGGIPVVGAGFFTRPEPDTQQARWLQQLRSTAIERNRALIGHLNQVLPQLSINFERDVKPLTPGGVPGEHHIITAYIVRAEKRFGDPVKRADFWAPLIGRDPATCRRLFDSPPAFAEALHAALVKKGDSGYQAAGATGLPTFDDFVSWTRSCQAIPLVTWCDAFTTSAADPCELLDLFIARGCAGLNISIADTNGNGDNSAQRSYKASTLATIIAGAERRQLPINIATGIQQPRTATGDPLASAELAPYRPLFLKGAHIMVGHTNLATFANMPYLGKAAAALFPNRTRRNNFFAAIGALPPITYELADKLLDAGPERALAALAGLAKKKTAHQR